jgi:triosephosphate isomerase
MTQVQKIIIANWKMNCLTADVRQYLDTFINKLRGTQGLNEIILCPAHVHLSLVLEHARASTLFKVGAQDCASAEKGAFTGDVSAAMIKDVGADYVLIGHSERRQNHHEDNTILKGKLDQALKNDLCPIFCVGETLLEREEGRTLEVIESQLSALDGLDHRRLVIAYEPVWAIGTGRVPSVDEVSEVHQGIISVLNKRGLKPAAILYGGSVTADNAAAFLSSPLIGGLLVGGASLDSESFYRIASL